MKPPKIVLDELKAKGLKPQGKWFATSEGHIMAYCVNSKKAMCLVSVTQTTFDWAIEVLISESITRVKKG